MKRTLFRWAIGMIALIVFATILPTAAVSADQKEAYDVTYTFTGDESTLAGYAQGIITITPPEGGKTSGYYLLYFADKKGVLSNYDELASIAITGNTVIHEIKDSTLISPKATRIAVFESDTRFLDNAPTIDKAVAIIDIPAEKRLSPGNAELTFGAIADVHMNYQAHNRGAYEKWESALQFFTERKTDCIIVAGDMTGDESDSPLTQQYQKYNDIIKASKYPADNIYECIGNHGNTADGRALFTQYTAGKNDNRPTEESPWYSVLIEGKGTNARDNLFLFMAQELEAPGDSAAYDNFSKEQIDWLEETLLAYENTNTNIFIVEHSPFLNYGPGDRENGDYTGMVTFHELNTQSMRLKALLEKYRDVVVMSGHTHLSLYDLENYGDENNNSCRMIHLGSGCQPTSYGAGLTLERSTDGRYPVTPTYGSEAYTVTVYHNYIIYRGYNLSTGKLIPAACYLLPIRAFAPSNTPAVEDLYSILDGSGTEKDPYLIEDAADFKAFTDAFNAGASKESEMFGNKQYFLQTANIDMRSIAGYSGVESSGTSPRFFAGTYNGGGHTLTVDITAAGQRAIFPVVYGTICNVILKGDITATESAQPIRTLYGNAINCLFEVGLYAPATSGICYVNYGAVYNVYASGTMQGQKQFPVAAADSSSNYINVYHYFVDADGTPIEDKYGIQSNDADTISEVFNNRESIQYQEAQTLIGTNEMTDLIISENDLDFETKQTTTTRTTTTTVVLATSPLASLSYMSWVAVLLVVMLAAVIIGFVVWSRMSKKY